MIFFLTSESSWYSLTWTRIIPDITITCFVFAFCSISFQQGNNTIDENEKANSYKNNGRKYKKSGLKLETANQLIADLEKIMKEEKLYLDCDLTIDDVSLRLGMPRYYISQVLNENLHKSFSTCINEYRIEEAKHMLFNPDSNQNNKSYSIIDIAFEAGFNSKSMFNLAFKKITGITPSEYKKRYSSEILNRKQEKIIIKDTVSDTPFHNREY